MKLFFLFASTLSRIGAAIVVDVQEYSVPLSDLAGNPQCFLVYEDLQARPDEWEDVSVCVCVCICMYVFVCLFVCVYLCACMHVCVRVCLHASVRACMHACMCVQFSAIY